MIKQSLKRLVGALALLASMSVHAESVEIYATHVGVGTTSGSPAAYSWYSAQQGLFNYLDNPFDGRSFGPFVQGSSAYLSAAELMSSGGASATGATLHYCIYSGAACSGGFVGVDLGLGAEANGGATTFTDAGGRVYDVAGDRQWNVMAPVDFLDNLGAGDFTLELYYSLSFLNGGAPDTLLSNNDGFNYRATFSVTAGTGGNVPEPSSLALAGLSLVLLAGLRRRPR